MEPILIANLKTVARGYYWALVTGTKLDVHKHRVRRCINDLYAIGVSRDKIEDILSDVAMEIC